MLPGGTILPAIALPSGALRQIFPITSHVHVRFSNAMRIKQLQQGSP